MKKIAIILIALLSIYGFWVVLYTGSFRYKLTLVVDDNGKQIVAFGVNQVSIYNIPILPSFMSYERNFKGEAIAIDLGVRGVVFAVLRTEEPSDYAYSIVYNEFPSPYVAQSIKGMWHYSNLKANKQLSFDRLPLLVRFRDINDQMTIEKVDPNDFERTFGKGVKLISATLEMTKEEVTTGIEKWLPWLKKWEEHGGTITGKFYSDNPRPEEILILSDFMQ